MMPGTNAQRSTLVALLGAIALHLALIASASGWLAPSVNPKQRVPVLIVALHRATAPAVTAMPAAAAAPASKPKAAPQAKHSAPPKRRRTAPKIVPQQKPQQRPPAATQIPHMPSQPLISAAPTAAPQPQLQTTPSSAQNHAPEAAPASASEISPIAAKTSVAIPAAYAARNRKPDYPLMSRRYNEQGTVVLRVLVNADGTAGDVLLRKSSTYPLLDQSALAAVRDWRFVAATRDGKPISEWYEISIPYTLRD